MTLNTWSAFAETAPAGGANPAGGKNPAGGPNPPGGPNPAGGPKPLSQLTDKERAINQLSATGPKSNLPMILIGVAVLAAIYLFVYKKEK